MKNKYEDPTDQKLSIKVFFIVVILISSAFSAVFFKIESPQEREKQRHVPHH